MSRAEGARRQCPECAFSAFREGRGGTTGYWAGQRIGPVMCGRCGHSMGYGVLAALPDFEPPTGEARGSKYFASGHEEERAGTFGGRSYSLHPRESRPPHLTQPGVGGIRGPTKGSGLGARGGPWESLHLREWWVLGLAFLFIVGVFAAILLYVQRGGDEASEPTSQDQIGDFAPVQSPTPSLAPTSDSALPPNYSAEAAVQQRVNQFRQGQDLTLLAPNGSLAEVARAHSKDMADRGYFDHNSPEGLGPQDRVERAGLDDFLCGENLFMVEDAKEDSTEFISGESFTGWLNSPGHYENMIKSGFDTGGVGIFVRSKNISDPTPMRYDIWVTHLLCTEISEYNQLKALYEAAQLVYDQLAVEYEALRVEYRRVEELYNQGQVPYSQVQEAYRKMEEAGVRLNQQVDEVNHLVDRLNKTAPQ
ncbi:MAG: CAP domain-containing protein, partial [Dehalococcoidia bacterium]